MAKWWQNRGDLSRGFAKIARNPFIYQFWRDGRVVECAGLLNR
jgi:hypothetical protein